VEPLLPWLSAAWAVGVMLFSARPLAGLVTVRRLRRRGLSPPSPPLRRLGDDLVGRMGIRRSVDIAQSALVGVPTVLGCLRPIVLLPASAVSGLSMQQLELILAHELAHVRRHDYLVNMLQTGIETLLFYHPATWWVSAQVRKERENCCDDVAVRLCGSGAAYVRALLAVAEQHATSKLALAATGGSLVQRARRLLSPDAPQTIPQRAGAWLAGILPMIAVLLLVGWSMAAKAGAGAAEPEADQPAPAEKEETPAEAGAEPSELSLTVTLEDGASEPLKLVLFDSYSRPLKTWDEVDPGSVKLKLPALEPERYRLEVSAGGYGVKNIALTVSRQGVRANIASLALFRRRYAILRYAVNIEGARTLTGPNVHEGSVAISFGSVPDLDGDWLIRQVETSPVFDFHRYGGNGFARPAKGVTFEEVDTAPQPDQYRPESVVAAPGTILLNRIQGNTPRERKYAKILVEDVTETPPEGIQVIDTLLPPTIWKRPPAAKSAELPNERTSGEVAVRVRLEDDILAPVTLALRDSTGTTLKTWEYPEPGEIRVKLPELEHDRYTLVAGAEIHSPASTPIAVTAAGVEPAEAQLELYRARYLILRYAINTKGRRNLSGADVKTGRVAVAFGRVPELVDWSVGQREGKPIVVYHRALPDTGFTTPAAGQSFDELETAPLAEEYSPGAITFEKGMVLFNRVVGHRPQDARYAKLVVEDITEARPQDVEIIDSSAK
jgi:beta-lactamase regulating signal transducer with metallopeptidase domain